MGDVWEQKELNITLSSLPVIIFSPPLIPLSCLPLPSLSLPPSVWIDLILLPYTPALLFGFTHFSLSQIHTRTHTHTNYCLFLLPLSYSPIHRNTHRHGNQICQSLVFVNTAAKVKHRSSLSFQLGLGISTWAKLWARLTKIEAQYVFECRRRGGGSSVQYVRVCVCMGTHPLSCVQRYVVPQ